MVQKHASQLSDISPKLVDLLTSYPYNQCLYKDCNNCYRVKLRLKISTLLWECGWKIYPTRNNQLPPRVSSLISFSHNTYIITTSGGNTVWSPMQRSINNMSAARTPYEEPKAATFENPTRHELCGQS